MDRASRRPLATSSTRYSLTIPIDPKMIATPATASTMAQIRPAPSSSWTSRNPTVVRVVTVWYSASSTDQPSSTTNPAVPTATASEDGDQEDAHVAVRDPGRAAAERSVLLACRHAGSIVRDGVARNRLVSARRAAI